MGETLRRLHKRYPLRRFEEWLRTEKGLGRSTAPSYVSAVRHALAAVDGDYTNEARLLAYIETLFGTKYGNATSAWRRFTEYLAVVHRKRAVELAYAEVEHDGALSPAEQAALEALRKLYDWTMEPGRRFGAFRLCHARFVEKRGVAWVLRFGEEAEPVPCSPRITAAINVLWERAGRPSGAGYRVWPRTPGKDDECPFNEFKRLLGPALSHRVAVAADREEPRRPKVQVPVMPPLPGMDGAEE